MGAVLAGGGCHGHSKQGSFSKERQREELHSFNLLIALQNFTAVLEQKFHERELP